MQVHASGPCMYDRRRGLVEQVEVVGDQHAHQRPRDARLVCAPSPRAFSRATTAQGDTHPSARSRAAQTGRRQRARREERRASGHLFPAARWSLKSTAPRPTYSAAASPPAASGSCTHTGAHVAVLCARRSLLALHRLATPVRMQVLVCTRCSACRRLRHPPLTADAGRSGAARSLTTPRRAWPETPRTGSRCSLGRWRSLAAPHT